MNLSNLSEKKGSTSFVAIEAVGIFVSYSLLFICSRDTLIRITAEDNWYENITAICFILASAMFAYLYFTSSKGNDFYFFKTKRNIFFLLLALLFFFGAGEEISWGQRIFGWSTPDAYGKINLQHETNIHNLAFLEREYYDKDGKLIERGGWLMKIFNENTMIDAFWVSWTLLVPVLYHFNSKCRSLIKSINIPFGTIQVGIMIFISNMLLHVVTSYMPFKNDLAVIHPVEVKECNMAFLFFMLAIIIYRKEKGAVAVTTLTKKTATADLEIAS